MHRYLSGAAAFAAAFQFAPAQGQTACGPHDKVVAQLADHYGEARRASGLTGDGYLMEIFAAPTGGWTILITLPGGPACIVGAGEQWQADRPTSRTESERGT